MTMKMNDYQDFTETTAVYPSKGELGGLVYAALGVNGEAGELAEQVKKLMRDDDGVIKSKRHDKMVKELGDVLWYAARVASELGVTLDYVATQNMKKLTDRQQRSQLQGSGNDR